MTANPVLTNMRSDTDPSLRMYMTGSVSGYQPARESYAVARE